MFSNWQLNMFHQLRTRIMREKAICLVPLIAIWLCFTLAPYCTPFWDSGIYVSMGNSIAKGNGSTYLGHTFKYPPVFPFMLALIIAPFGYNFVLMRLVMVASAVGSIWLAYLIVRDRSNRWLATGVMVSTAFSFPILYECTRLLSELPYMFFSLLAIRWIERYARQADSWRSKTGYIAIGLIMVAYFTRIVGVTLFAGAIAYLTLGGTNISRSWTNLKKAIVVGVILFTVLPLWLVRNHLSDNKFPPELRQGLSYRKELFVTTTERPDAQTIRWTNLWERIKDNGDYYERLLSNIVSGKQKRVASRGKRRPDTRAQVITLLLLAGYLICVFRHRSLIECYLFFYLLIYILWPAHQKERFLVPIIPFLFYYLFRLLEQFTDGIRWLVRRVAQWPDQRKMIEVFGVLILTGVFVQWNWATDMRIIRNEKSDSYYTGRYGVLVDFAKWITENAPDDAVLISSEPAFVQIILEDFASQNKTNRKTYGFPWTEPSEVLQFMDRIGTSYVISVPSGRAKQHLHPAIKQHPDRFRKVHQYGKYVIYQMFPPKPSG